MPQMADITVKAADGTTDVIFNAMTPSAGDTVPALWRAEALGFGIASNKPTFWMKTQYNGARTARRAEFKFNYPRFVTVPASSTTQVVSEIPGNLTLTLPTNVPDVIIADAYAFYVNLLSSTLVRNSVIAGFAPT